MQTPMYPDVLVQLRDDDDGPTMVGLVAQALHRQVGPQAAEDFRLRAAADSTYHGVLRIALDTVDLVRT